jgi:hypothetical protein
MSSAASVYRDHEYDGVSQIEYLERLIFVMMCWFDKSRTTLHRLTIDKTIQKSSQPFNCQQVSICTQTHRVTGLRVSLSLPYSLRMSVTKAIEVKTHVTTTTAVPVWRSPPAGGGPVDGVDMMKR